MLSESVLQSLLFQLQHENQNSFIYRFFAGIADYQSLTGTCNWFMKRHVEEKEHFEKIASYIQTHFTYSSFSRVDSRNTVLGRTV
jgi:ferritin